VELETSNNVNKDFQRKEECKCQLVKELMELNVEDHQSPELKKENKITVKIYKI
jgi:hypothetical protein